MLKLWDKYISINSPTRFARRGINFTSLSYNSIQTTKFNKTNHIVQSLEVGFTCLVFSLKNNDDDFAEWNCQEKKFA